MNTYTYHKEIRIIIASVLAAFDGVVLKRFVGSDEEEVVDEIRVPVIYDPKQRVLFHINNTSNHIKLPLLAVWMTGLSRDKSRVFNKTDGYWQNENVDKMGRVIPQPVPVNFTFEMSFFGRFMKDCDQFLTCMFSNFNPYIEISYKHPDIDEEVRCSIEWDGNVKLDYPNQDLDGTKPLRLFVNATFTVASYIFRNAPVSAGRIHNIKIPFTALSEVGEDFKWMESQEDVDDESGNQIKVKTDRREVLGKPFVLDSSKGYAFVGAKLHNIVLTGNMFNETTMVVATNLSETSTSDVFESSAYESFDLFSDVKTLSATYPEFRGVGVEFSVLDDQTIKLSLPAATNAGNVDIWVCNPYGIGKLSEDSYREYLSPDSQKSTVSGISILPY